MGGSFSPISLPSRVGSSVNASIGWLTNLENQEIKNFRGERVTGNTISQALNGFNVGSSGCYTVICIGYGKTMSPNPDSKSYNSFEFGVGKGGHSGSINQEMMFNVGEE